MVREVIEEEIPLLTCNTTGLNLRGYVYEDGSYHFVGTNPETRVSFRGQLTE